MLNLFDKWSPGRRASTSVLVLGAVLTAGAVSLFGQETSFTNQTVENAGGMSVATAGKIGFNPTAAVKEPVPEAPKAPSGGGGEAYGTFRFYVFKVTRTNGNNSHIEYGTTVTKLVDFKYGTEMGYKGEGGWSASKGFGFRGSYFFTRQNASESLTATGSAPFIYSDRPLNVTYLGNASPSAPYANSQRFEMQVGDIEGTYRWHGGNWSALVSAGLRIAHTDQLNLGTDNCCGAAGTNPEELRYQQTRTGYGPTGAIDVRAGLGGSGFSWIGRARFAEIFGTIKETASYRSGSPLSGTPVTRSSSPHSWVIEGETGIEYAHKHWFIDGSFIFHDWNKIVVVTGVPAIGATDPNPLLDPPASAPSRMGAIRYLGGSFSFGFRF